MYSILNTVFKKYSPPVFLLYTHMAGEQAWLVEYSKKETLYWFYLPLSIYSMAHWLVPCYNSGRLDSLYSLLCIVKKACSFKSHNI